LALEIRNANSNFKDIPRKREGKISVEVSFFYMRATFERGTRIQQGLRDLPDFYKERRVCVQNLELSRTINAILKKHRLNGYPSKHKTWKFFRAKKPNEPWQVDLKEFKLCGKKHYIFVVIDDYSRFILSLQLFDHCPTTNELTATLEKLKIKPESMLADNEGQFREQWKRWSKQNQTIIRSPLLPIR